jgi:hypothetical protein
MPINRFVFIINGRLIDLLSKNYSRALKKAMFKYLSTQDFKGVRPGTNMSISLTFLAKFSPYDKKWRERVRV